MDAENLTAEEYNQFIHDELQGIEEGKNTAWAKPQETERRESVHLQSQESERKGIAYAKLQGREEGQKERELKKNHDEGKITQESETPPDPQKDFMGYIQWLGKTLQKQELLRAQQQNMSAPSEAEHLYSFFHQSAAAVKQQHQDFDQAADFVYDVRAKQLAAFSSLYPEMADPKVIEAIIGDELKQIVQDCAKKNQNPAEVIYTIAQKIGYTNTQSAPVENIQERQNSARTLAAHNGLTSSGSLSLDMIDKMSEAEFSVWINDPKNKAAFNRLMGGGDL
ncbi:hypothetical protein BAnh1_10920 [Bartonella australis AUST/NH1]|uniref:Phage protein n=1 Tax=Bartonella australis (strain Aust/NH1) TaxID=1094489 RepID=M1P536_BARAA|nr:hypothetical protein [Bartonella australis]AGF74960.1 hypothetical protein BAnh1_10920 [Bartonella australis AUST/NH1]